MNLSSYYYFDWIEKVSDKGTDHSYIQQYYCKKFTPLKNTPIIMLEIGIYKSQSLRLWKEWFTNSFIYCMDVDQTFVEKANTIPNVKAFNLNAFDKPALNLFNDGFFDVIIEDGPHTFETQRFAVANWSKKLKKGGTLIIEDIQSIDWIEFLVKAIPNEENAAFEYKLFDLRSVKNRYDDILLEITRIK